jgi:polyhydroxyalkanoate synthesis regulator phasin
MQDDRIIQQVDRMVASGRITETEAAQLRAAEGTPAFDVVVGTIRARHAGAHMEAAVAEGDMSQDEAEGYLERLRSGEHAKGLRARLRMHRSHAEGDVTETTDP